jgi:hypothetical protein
MALSDMNWLSRFDGSDLGPETVEAFWFLTTDATRRCVGWSAAYFAWELVHELWNSVLHRRVKLDDLAHALMSFIGYSFMGFYLGQAHVALCLALTSEASTPFFNLYRLATDEYYSALTKAQSEPRLDTLRTRRVWAQMAFAAMFTLVRVLWQPLFAWYRVAPFIRAGWSLATLVSHCFAAFGATVCPPAAPIALVELSISILLNFTWFALIVAAAFRLSKPKLG